MGMLVASFRVPYRGMPIIACYQFQAAKLRFFPETTKYFFFFLRNILEKSIIRNYSAPPMGMSNRLTVVLQQELH